MPKTAKKPSYLLHRATGQARVRIAGKDHYLGEFGSPESRERYDKLISEWFRKNDVKQSTIRIDDLALLYLNHVDQLCSTPPRLKEWVWVAGSEALRSPGTLDVDPLF